MLRFRRINYNEDLDEIIKLIHKNLDSEFTAELFLWKHLENPFGKSYGLLALDQEKIVGLRMFMFWKFENLSGGKGLIAIRPVDTVVDEKYRGQGLFKRLTLTGLEECKEAYDFIFNTPNGNSLPGYLKMGWEKLNKDYNFKIAVLNPIQKTLAFNNIDPNIIKTEIFNSTAVTTQKDQAYFKWRYKNSKYKIAYFSEQNIYVAYQLSSKYLIIDEVFGDLTKLSVGLFNSLGKKNSKYLMYFYSNEIFDNLQFILAIKRNKPDIVLKDYGTSNLSIKDLSFSLADLEAVF